MIRVYPSSKVKHAPMWRELQKTVPHVFFNARWIKRAEIEKKEEMDVRDYRDLWSECLEDIRNSDALLLYAEDGDQLKGALVEVGMALAFGVKVILVTAVEDWYVYGTWMHYNVTKCETIEQAMDYLYLKTGKSQRKSRDKFIAEMIAGKFSDSPQEPKGCCGGTGENCDCN